MDETKHLGTLKVEGGSMLVCDPCYIPDALHPGLVAWIEGCGPEAEVYIELTDDTGGWGTRVRELRAEFGRGGEPCLIGHVAVDSGQMAMFDASKIDGWGGDERPGGLFEGFNPEQHAGEFNYQGVCNLTHADDGRNGGVLPSGAVAASSSGFGDGLYDLYVARDASEAVTRVAVRFIEEEGDAEEWEDENENPEEEDE